MDTSFAPYGRTRSTWLVSSAISCAVRRVLESHWPRWPGRHPPPRSAVRVMSWPARPQPRTAVAVAPSAVTANDGATPSWVCPPISGKANAADPARRPTSTRAACAAVGEPSASSAPTGAAPIAARSLAPTSTPHQPAHSGSRSTIEGRMASTLASTDEPGTGAASSPTKPAPPGDRPASSSPSPAFVAPTSAATRPTGQRISTCRTPATSTLRRASQPQRANRAALSGSTVASKRSAPRRSASAQAAVTSARPAPLAPRRSGITTSRPPCHQPGATSYSRTPPTTRPGSLATSSTAWSSWSSWSVPVNSPSSSTNACCRSR